jgi:aspartate/methionine/tyrosine aminotransferase
MRQRLISAGANELSYEIREIVKKAELIQQQGQEIYWENIGDPIQKNHQMPQWIKETIASIALDNQAYGYCPSKGILETREFLAQLNNQLGGVQITPDDICFVNGLGDGIAKVYQFISHTSRVIGPSPAYSTHSSAEAAHAKNDPLTYKLDPDNHWYPDIEDLYNKVKYNPSIVGILIINPDNPTGMVYPLETLQKIVKIAQEFNLFLLSDEIYLNITYNGVKAIPLANVVENVPAIAMKGISKELPWPGARCGWLEYYNRDKDEEFNQFCMALDNAKMIEVCSTKLPQMAIPRLMKDERYAQYRQEVNEKIGKRSKIITEILQDLPQIRFNTTYGAFYNTIIFKENILKEGQKMHIQNKNIQNLVEKWTSEKIPLDKRFVYYLLGAKGVCVVPISSFCSELQGFRVTLLEENEEILYHTFKAMRAGIEEYCI